MDVMRGNGWRFENISTAEHTCMVNDDKALAECNSSPSWYGWGCESSSGILRTTLNGSGIMNIQYGNCWEGGNVQIFVNNTLKDSASSHRYKEVSFEYDEGTKVTIMLMMPTRELIFECLERAHQLPTLQSLRNL